MKLYKRNKESISTPAYLNFALTLAKGLMVLLLATLALMSLNHNKSDGVKPPAEFVIEVHWKDGTDIDIDTWLRVPGGQDVWFQNKEVGFVNLERDEQGRNSNMVVNGKTFESTVREELTSIRGILPGEYVLNLHLYRVGDKEPAAKGIAVGKTGTLLAEPISARIIIKKINPVVAIVYQGDFEFTEIHQELHATRFTIHPDGSIDTFDNNLPISLTKNHFDPGGSVIPDGAPR